MTSKHDNSSERFLKTLAATSDKKTFRLGMDYIDQILWYGVEIEGKAYFLRTGGDVCELTQLPSNLVVHDGAVHGSPISADGMRRYLQGGEVNGAKLISELAAYFARHAKFQNHALPTVLALWVVAGYAHMAFPIFPYLSITSAQPGCGKTRILELLAEVGFRAKPLIINPTSAVLYRSLHDSAQVMLIDEFEDATDDGKKAMITVLNSGFQRGALVPRCVGDEHNVKYFQAYSPKAFSGLSRIPDTLRTRSIPILMMPKTKGDKIEPFYPTEYEKQTTKWRDNAGIWALRNAPKLASAVMNRGKLGIPAFLNDRQVDYMTTLFATAQVAGLETDVLREFCHDLASTRLQGTNEGQGTRAAKALAAWFPADQTEAKLFLSEAAWMFLQCEALAEPDEREAGNLLRNMGLDVRQIRVGSITRKGVIITRQELEKLAGPFGVPVAEEHTVEMADAA
jgi:hypothetical protein